MNRFESLFGRLKAVVIGMVHVRALPGTPKSALTMDEIAEIACKEAEVYAKAGMDGIMIENMHDVPYCQEGHMTPDTIACMTRVCHEIRRQFPSLPIGVQVLSAANAHALAIAKATGLNFIRAEGFVFSHIGDDGPINSCAAQLLRYRKHIDAEDVQVFTDIKKKHSSHAITSDVSILETAKAAELFLSDGVIVTGAATGLATDPKQVEQVLSGLKIPVLVGSGVTVENLQDYMDASAIIVGSHFKMSGKWDGEVDYIRVDHFMGKLQKLRARQDIGKVEDKHRPTFTPISAQGE